MSRSADKTTRFRWQYPAFAGSGAGLVFIPLILWSSDFGEILYLLLAALVTLILLILLAVKRGHRLTILATLLAFLAVSSLVTKNNFEVRSRCRWIIASRLYKNELFSQASSTNGTLKHMEWDGWGGFGAGDTTAYLVFDPDDNLAPEVKSRSSGRFKGIPCGVWRAGRLESRWYYMLFYTDTAWDYSGPSSEGVNP